MAASPIRYRLHLEDIPAKRLGVQIDVDHPGDELRLRMPSWVPGSYLMREYAGHVVWLRAEADGRELTTRKVDKSTWLVDTAGVGEVNVRYDVFAPDLSVRSNDITHDHAFVNSAGTFLQVEGAENQNCRLQVAPPKGWWVHAAAPPAASDPGPGPDQVRVFELPDYDTLVDTPLALGPQPALKFEAGGITHELVIHGEGNFDIHQMIEDFQKIIENEVELFGAHPIDRYLFILLLTESGMGGLEHANSSALAWPSLKFRPSIEYHRFLTLVAHEYFHLWNVKRIRPEVFLQYDYSREVYTRLLWVFEGITNYYDELIPLRAGVYDTKRYLGFLAENTQGEAARPGREVQSVAESSFDTWIKLYRPSPDSANSQVSYYQRGQLVALLLDLHIRAQTEDKKSLDDVLRYLYQQIYQAGRGLGEDEFASCVQTATGVDVEDFLATYVNGTATLEYEAAFQHVGLRLRPKRQKPEQKRGWLGATVQKKEGGSVLAGVRVGGSAHAAGLMAGDEVIALDGHRIRTDLDERLKLYRGGETAKWVVFRQGRLLEGEMTFMENPYPPLELIPVDEPTDAQMASFLAWTHVELKPPSPSEDSD